MDSVLTKATKERQEWTSSGTYSHCKRLYSQQRPLSFAAARAERVSGENTYRTENLLHSMKRDKYRLFGDMYYTFLLNNNLPSSIQSLKLLFLDIEYGFKDIVWCTEYKTVRMMLEEIRRVEIELYYNEQMEKKTTNQSRKKTRTQTTEHTSSAPQEPAPKKRPQTPPPQPVPVISSVQFSVYQQVSDNIEALQYHMNKLLTTDDYMRFIFTNKDIEARFHKYINNIMVHRTDGEKFLELEQHIDQRRLLMHKVSQIPKNGQTFIIPSFANDQFIVPCSKEEYTKRYCEDFHFYLPPGHETLTQPPTHPGLYKRTMNGIRQIDPNCQKNASEQGQQFIRTRRGRGRGTVMIKKEQ